MINLLRVTDLYRQHSIVQATFSFDLKSPAFKCLLKANTVVDSWDTIPTKMGCIEPPKQIHKENKHHKDVYTE